MDSNKPSPPVPRTLSEFRELQRRATALETRLAEIDAERADDAGTLGRLLAELAERDRQLGRVLELEAAARRAEARADAEAARADDVTQRLDNALERIGALVRELDGQDAVYAETIADLEAAQDRFHAAAEERERLHAELVEERERRETAEQALADANLALEQARAENARLRRASAPPPKPSMATLQRLHDRSRLAFARAEIPWLLETIEVVLAQVRDATRTEAKELDDTRAAVEQLVRRESPDDARELARSIAAMLRHTVAVDRECDVVHGVVEVAGRGVEAAQRAPIEGAAAADIDVAELAEDVARTLRTIRDTLAPLLGAQRERTNARPPPPRRPTGEGAR